MVADEGSYTPATGRITARNLDNVTNGAAGITQVPVPPGPEIDGRAFFNTIDAERWYWLALTILILIIWLARRLEHSRVGRAWLAIREDEDAAAVMGVAGFKFKLWAFAIGATLGGLAGLDGPAAQRVVERALAGKNNFMLDFAFHEANHCSINRKIANSCPVYDLGNHKMGWMINFCLCLQVYLAT